MAKTQSPRSYDRAQKRKAAIQVRALIDAATPATFSGDVHPLDVTMVADDLKQEQKDDPRADPVQPLVILAQIPPFRVGRSTYRVIAERVVKTRRWIPVLDGRPDDSGLVDDVMKGEVALICRTRPSTLHQHPRGCLCAPCGYLPEWCVTNGRYVDLRDLWYHDATRTYHLRVEHSTWVWLGRDYADKARVWAMRSGRALQMFTTADGQLQ